MLGVIEPTMDAINLVSHQGEQWKKKILSACLCVEALWCVSYAASVVFQHVAQRDYKGTLLYSFFCVSTTQHQWNQAISWYYLRCHILWTGKAITGLDWACGGCICTKSKCCQEDEIISLTVTPHTWPILRPQGHTGDLVTGLPLTLYPQSRTASSVSHTQLVRAMQSDVGGRQPVDMEHNKQM